MENKKSTAELVSETIKMLESTEPTGMTKEQTTILLQRVMQLAKQIGPSLLEYENMAKLGTEQIKKLRETILKLDKEIATCETFITAKGLTNEYHRFKGKRLKKCKNRALN